MFGVAVELPWDKSPNQFGLKMTGANPTGAMKSDDSWHHTYGSLGCQMILLAMQQRLLVEEDLRDLAHGVAVSVPELIARRKTAWSDELPQDAESMCAHVDLGFPQ